MTWTRVKNKITGHHQTVAVVLPEHEVLKGHPAVNANGDPLPAKHNTTKAAGGRQSSTTKAAEAKPKEK